MILYFQYKRQEILQKAYSSFFLCVPVCSESGAQQQKYCYFCFLVSVLLTYQRFVPFGLPFNLSCIYHELSFDVQLSSAGFPFSLYLSRYLALSCSLFVNPMLFSWVASTRVPQKCVRRQVNFFTYSLPPFRMATKPEKGRNTGLTYLCYVQHPCPWSLVSGVVIEIM